MIKTDFKNLFLAGFVDVALNMSLLFIAMFVVLILIVGKKNDAVGKIDTVDTLLITMKWNNEVNDDMDIHVMNPIGDVINFQSPNRDKPWGTLERDDLGYENDYNYIDQTFLPVKHNREVIHLRNPIDGHYVVNVHLYTTRNSKNLPQNIEVEFIQLVPSYRVLFTKKYNLLKLEHKEEFTLFSFDIDSTKKRINVNTTEQRPFVMESLRKEQ